MRAGKMTVCISQKGQEKRVLIAGFGGQGIMLLGKMLAQAAVLENKNVTYIRSYGAEMRGGTASCLVKISNTAIASPVFEQPSIAIIMNQPSWDRFKPRFSSQTVIILNSSLVTDIKGFAEKNLFKCPLNELALSLGDVKVANSIALGAVVKICRLFEKTSLVSVIEGQWPANTKLAALNVKALEAGWKIH